MTITLVLGGARSGKSRRGQTLAEGSSPKRLYIATAQAFDDEMRDRISKHQHDRDDSWKTIEAPLDLAGAIRTVSTTRDASILVDCLTLWLSNLLLVDQNISAATAELVNAVQSANAPIVLVSNEVGMGIVPENALARQFRDEQGRLNQNIAQIADHVEFVAAGLSLKLKG